MTDMAVLTVEVGFSSPTTGTYLHLDDEERGLLNSATLAPDNLWVDVTEWVTSVSTRRGATRVEGPTLRFEAGTATIVLRNEDRRFDPTNLAGPYVAGGATQVEPMRAVRIRATWNGVTYSVWRGFADDWQVAYDGPTASVVTLTCSDAFRVFAGYDRNAIAAVGSGENSGARIHRILDSIGWSTVDRVIDGGDVTLQATTLADNALSELLLTADSELGEFFIDPHGRPRYRNRTAIQDNERSAVAQAKFGDAAVGGVDTTINLATCPSLETDSVGWIAGGSVSPTLSRSSVQAVFGSWSLLATWGTGGLLPLVNYDVSGLTVGRTYTISVYVWVPTGSPVVVPIVASTDHFGTNSTLFDAWERLTWTGVATATTMGFQLWPLASPTAGQQVWIDGLQVEEGNSASAYVDGDQAGCEWDGIPHASTSRRLPELPYTDAVLTSDATQMANLISIARAGGTAQVVEDAASRTAYLTSTHQRHDLLVQTDGAALVYAEQLLARASTPELRFSQLVLNPRREAQLWIQALSREIGQRLRVVRRPPGGGDPITRDVFLRGVEHEVSPEQWTTRFVLQHAPTISRVTDTFTRTAANGWGSASTGQVWATSGGTAADFAVSGGSGRHILSSVNVQRNSLVDVGAENVTVTVDVQPPGVPPGAPITHWVVARAADLNNHYIGRLDVAITGVVTIALYKRVAGVLSAALVPAVSVGMHSSGNVWRVVFQTAGSSVRAKAWKPASASDPGWQAAAVDSSLTSGTQVGLLARRETGNTSGTVTVFYDNFAATSLYAWA
ncbi:hypothetical protein [Micromonospora sp. NPDC005113]